MKTNYDDHRSSMSVRSDGKVQSPPNRRDRKRESSPPPANWLRYIIVGHTHTHTHTNLNSLNNKS